jgi:serine phosphatase RsbU (regulator of sigma subunit)/anti-sigma regulatory factor (Ser/Thr protein kinase)
LPADRRTPAAARAVVRAALTEVQLTELIDEAMLLTTELSTNGVLHAGTDIDLEVAVDDDGIVITVTDFADRSPTASLPSLTVDIPDEMSESGRGLLLVDRFAASWGVVHHDFGKGVWFRLSRKAATGGPVEETGPVDDTPPDLAALVALAEPDRAGTGQLAWSAREAGETLARLCAAVRAAGALLLLDRADGRGLLPLAEHGRPADPATLRLPLAVARPWQGELQLTGVLSGYAAPLARLVADRLGLALENHRLRRAEQRRQTALTFLAESSDLLAQSLDVDLTMALIPRLVVPRLGQWCAVWSMDTWGDPVYATAAHADEAALPGLTRMLERVLPTVREASRGRGALALPGNTEGFVLPLVARGQRLGALAVGSPAGHRHDADDMAMLQDLCRRAALALENARIHAERQGIARNLQEALLPPALPQVPGLGFGAEYVPTAGNAEMGGDFYDVVARPEGGWLVVVGDVSGKGVPAAIVTGVVRDVIRVLVRDGRPLDEILFRINETLVERGDGRYCTLVLAGVDQPDPGRLTVDLHLAGHDRPVLVTADGKAAQVGTPGTALGLLATVQTPVQSVSLAPGDTLVLSTDGVTERRRGTELFGVDRLCATAGSLAGYSAEAFAARLRAATLSFSTEPARDDIAILTLRNDAPAT